jgi:hypothetical protein
MWQFHQIKQVKTYTKTSALPKTPRNLKSRRPTANWHRSCTRIRTQITPGLRSGSKPCLKLTQFCRMKRSGKNTTKRVRVDSDSQAAATRVAGTSATFLVALAAMSTLVICSEAYSIEVEASLEVRDRGEVDVGRMSSQRCRCPLRTRSTA